MENQSAQQSASQNNEEHKSETPTIIPTPTQTNTEAIREVEEVKQPQVISAPVVETPQPPAQVEETKEPIVSPPKIETPVVQTGVAPKQPDVKVSIPIESKDQERTTIQNSNIIDKVDNSVSQENSINNSGLNVALDSQENTSFSVQNKNQEDSSVYLKLFVGGLYYQTEEDVNNYFAKYGEIVDCQLLRHRQTGRSRGFAFVTIRDPTGSVKKVLLGRRNEINGKYVDIKLAEDNKTREKIEQSSCKVFVGGIEGSVSTEELRDYFQVMGNVKEAVVLKNINTNISRGFGFVTFEDKNVADQLIRENNCVLKGKRMDIKSAEPKESSAQKSIPGRRDFNYNMPMEMGRPQNFRPQYQNDYNNRGYQRNYQPRESKPYSHNKYDHYTQQQVMYPEYQMPYHQVEQPPVATIAPYAPPAQPVQQQSSYKYYQNYSQPAQTQPSYKQSSYSSGGGNQYGGGSAGYGGGSRQPKEQMYEKSYAPQQNYQPYQKSHHSEPYMGGPSRDYQQSKNRYKPY